MEDQHKRMSVPLLWNTVFPIHELLGSLGATRMVGTTGHRSSL